MTSLSRFDSPPTRVLAFNLLKAGKFPFVAHPLLHMFLVVCAVTQVGCPFPPPLEVEQADGGSSSPPVITDNVSPEEFRFPGPITLFRNDARSFSLSLRDAEVNELLFVRMYVDYQADAPTNFLSDCVAASNGEVIRQASCPAARLCDDIPNTDTESHALDVMVSDREFLPSGDPAAEGQPAFRAVASGGVPTIRTWLMKCEDMQ